MSNKLKIVLVGIVLVLAVVIVVSHLSSKKGFGNTAPTNCTGTVTCFTDVAVSNLYATVDLWLGGNTAATAQQTIVTTGTCATASTTLFAVLNPFGATSTVRLINITGTGQASSTNLLVGTSTAPSGYNPGTISPTLVANWGPAMATSTSFIVRSGQITGLGTNQVQAATSSSVTATSVVVGASEFVGAFSTSTYPFSGVAANTGNFSPAANCTYKLEWQQ